MVNEQIVTICETRKKYKICYKLECNFYPTPVKIHIISFQISQMEKILMEIEFNTLNFSKKITKRENDFTSSIEKVFDNFV